MPPAESIAKFEGILKESISRGDWSQVERARERLSRLLIDATIQNRPGEIGRIASALATAHRQVVLQHGVSPSGDPATAAWMLKGGGDVATIALQARPHRTESAADAKSLAARDKMLVAAAKSNHRALSNKALAEASGVAEETVCRLMPLLEAEGLFECWRAGVHALNAITREGRQRAGEIDRAVSRENSFALPAALEALENTKEPVSYAAPDNRSPFKRFERFRGQADPAGGSLWREGPVGGLFSASPELSEQTPLTNTGAVEKKNEADSANLSEYTPDPPISGQSIAQVYAERSNPSARAARIAVNELPQI